MIFAPISSFSTSVVTSPSMVPGWQKKWRTPSSYPCRIMFNVTAGGVIIFMPTLLTVRDRVISYYRRKVEGGYVRNITVIYSCLPCPKRGMDIDSVAVLRALPSQEPSEPLPLREDSYSTRCTTFGEWACIVRFCFPSSIGHQRRLPAQTILNLQNNCAIVLICNW